MNKVSSAWNIFNDKEVLLEPPSNYLSFGDLQRLPEFRLALMRQNKEAFEKILFDNGADVSKGYNVSSSTHRMRTSNGQYTGFRVDFTERLDEKWIKSGAASEEAYFHSMGKDMVDELIALDPRKSKNKKEWMQDRELSIKFDVSGDTDE